MRKVLTICVVLFTLAVVAPVFATIESVNVSYLHSSFSPVGGSYNLGNLTIVNSFGVVVVEDDQGVQTPYTNVPFLLSTSLSADNSVNGIVDGVFSGGSLSIQGLLEADVISMRFTELYNGGGILAGAGSVSITGGALAPDFGNIGNLVQIMFAVNPSSISDLSQGFTGISNITLMPVPEPATLAILGLGGLALLHRRKSA